MKTFLFFCFIMLVSFSYCTLISPLGYTQEIEKVPEFVQLSEHPVAKGFFSFAAIRLRENTANAFEPTNSGYARIMAIVAELIHNNRVQLQEITRINHRVQGQCLISSTNLKSRAANFKSLMDYFKLHAKNSLKEKSEAIDMKNNRNVHIKDYSIAKSKFARVFARTAKKWDQRIGTAKYAVAKAEGAIQAINEWKPATTHAFIQTAVRESVAAYTQCTSYPLVFDYTFVQLAANDNRVKKRLFEWLNMLKATLVNSLDFALSAKREVTNYHEELDRQLSISINLLNKDVSRLNRVITNSDMLIKDFSSNEAIYTGLHRQTLLVVDSSKKWCRVEEDSFVRGKNRMAEQIRVFHEVKEWFRTNFSKVRDWIKKKY